MVELPLSATYTLPSLPTAIPWGLSKSAPLPVPSVDPVTPANPARVVTTPALVTIRMVSLPESTTYTLPLPSTAAPQGLEKVAAAPTPSADPVLPAFPASVVTAPALETLRIALLPESATYRFPLPSTAMPRGELNWALFPVASVDPLRAGVPARVVTKPALVIILMVSLPVSET